MAVKKSPIDWEAYRKFVVKRGQERKANFPDKFRVDDYIAGAACVFFFLGDQLELPADWVFGLMAGGDPLAETPKRKAK